MELHGYNLPEDLYYDPNHFWVRDEGELLVMGMDDFARQMAGEIVYVQLPDDGKKLKAGKKLAKVESGKWLGQGDLSGGWRTGRSERGTGDPARAYQPGLLRSGMDVQDSCP